MLTDRLSKGDHVAFSKLYDMYWEDLYRFVNSKIGDPKSAEDILHDLFLSLWKNKDRINEIKSLRAYLYSSCRYLIIAHLNKEAKKEWNDQELAVNLPDSSASLEDKLHYRYILDQLNAEVDRLPERCKEVFKLSREQELSNIEISKHLGVSESTVENHINKALKRLRVVAQHFLSLLIFFNFF